LNTEQTPFDPQRVYTEIARLVQLLSPGADMIELRFELGGRKAKLPIPTISDANDDIRLPIDVAKPGSLAAEILQVLREHPSELLTGADVAAKIGGNVNWKSGAFITAIRKLKDAKLIEHSSDENGQGYRLIG